MKPALQRLQEQMLLCITAGATSDRHAIDNISFINDSLLKTTHLTPERSLAIYQYGYKARLLECLKADFPVLKTLLGETLFGRFAAEYLDAYPSSSYSLFQLGEYFPDFLQNSCPDISKLSESQQACYLLPIELARLERLRVNAMRAPGMEDYPYMEPDYADPEKLGKMRPRAAKTLGLMRSVHNLPDYYQAMRGAGDDIEIMPAADLSLCHIAVSRSNYRLTIHALNAWQYTFLSELQKTGTDNDTSLAEQIEKVVQQENVTQEYLYAHLPLWLPVAVARGYLYL